MKNVHFNKNSAFVLAEEFVKSSKDRICLNYLTVD